MNLSELKLQNCLKYLSNFKIFVLPSYYTENYEAMKILDFRKIFKDSNCKSFEIDEKENQIDFKYLIQAFDHIQTFKKIILEGIPQDIMKKLHHESFDNSVLLNPVLNCMMEELSLSGLFLIESETLKAFFMKNCTKLKKFRLSQCHLQFDNLLKYFDFKGIIQKMNNLESFKLDHVYNSNKSEEIEYGKIVSAFYNHTKLKKFIFTIEEKFPCSFDYYKGLLNSSTPICSIYICPNFTAFHLADLGYIAKEKKTIKEIEMEKWLKMSNELCFEILFSFQYNSSITTFFFSYFSSFDLKAISGKKKQEFFQIIAEMKNPKFRNLDISIGEEDLGLIFGSDEIFKPQQKLIYEKATKKCGGIAFTKIDFTSKYLQQALINYIKVSQCDYLQFKNCSLQSWDNTFYQSITETFKQNVKIKSIFLKSKNGILDSLLLKAISCKTNLSYLVWDANQITQNQLNSLKSLFLPDKKLSSFNFYFHEQNIENTELAFAIGSKVKSLIIKGENIKSNCIISLFEGLNQNELLRYFDFAITYLSNEEADTFWNCLINLISKPTKIKTIRFSNLPDSNYQCLKFLEKASLQKSLNSVSYTIANCSKNAIPEMQKKTNDLFINHRILFNLIVYFEKSK